MDSAQCIEEKEKFDPGAQGFLSMKQINKKDLMRHFCKRYSHFKLISDY